jgi:hypothetical protein
MVLKFGFRRKPNFAPNGVWQKKKKRQTPTEKDYSIRPHPGQDIAFL